MLIKWLFSLKYKKILNSILKLGFKRFKNKRSIGGKCLMIIEFGNIVVFKIIRYIVNMYNVKYY